MQTRKLIGIALIAALVGSVSAVAVSAAETEIEPPKITTYGIIGSINGAWDTDTPMTDEDGDGIFVGVIKDVAPGSYEFKVRADGSWDQYSWGEYEEEYDRTNNSQTNCSITLEETANVVVKIDTNGEDFNVWPVTYYAYVPQTAYGYFGVIGSINGAWDTDTIMSDENGDGVYTATIPDVQPGTYEFKVRADGQWTETGSWGVYEKDYDRTNNSQTNCSITLDVASDVTVELDVSGDDFVLWPVSYSYTNADGIKVKVYTGPEAETPDDPEESQPEESQPEESQPEESQPEESQPEESQPEESQPETSTAPEVSTPEYYETSLNDYIYFDNSATKWDKVCAYWWNADLGETVNVFGQGYGAEWPGVEMTQVPGTDIYQVLVPYGATKIIFSSGMTDDEIAGGAIGYQTADLDFSSEINPGQIYTIDTSVEPKPGRGVEKTKFKYSAGEWTDYTGEFLSEQFGEQPKDDPTTEISNNPTEESKEPTSQAPVVSNNGNSNGGNGTVTDNGNGTVNTGDAGAMTAGLVVLAAAALCTGVVVAKKKTSDEE